MPAPQFDLGQREIAAFNTAATSGAVHFDEQAAHQAKQQYDRMISGLIDLRRNLRQAVDGRGFGGFDSGRELQVGFSRKATEGVEVLSQLIDGAIQLQQAYLRAAGLIQEADKLNETRMKLSDPQPGVNETK